MISPDPSLDAVVNELAAICLARSSPSVTVGVDVEELERWSSSPSRLDRLFTPGELVHCQTLANPRAQFAGIWCVKEAVVKALSGVAVVSPRDVEVLHDPTGRPRVRLSVDPSGSLAATISVSVSRTSSVAVAVAVHVPAGAAHTSP